MQNNNSEFLFGRIMASNISTLRFANTTDLFDMLVHHQLGWSSYSVGKPTNAGVQIKKFKKLDNIALFQTQRV